MDRYVHEEGELVGLTVSQVLASHPEAITDAASGVGSQVSAVDQQVGDARRRLDRMTGAWSGAAADSARTNGAAIVSDQAKYGETLRTLQQTLSSGGEQMTAIRANLQSSVDAAVGSGWSINDDGRATPGPTLQQAAATSQLTAIQVQLAGLRITTSIMTDLAHFQAADESTAAAMRKLAGIADTPAAPAPTPAPAPPVPAAGKNPADIAKEYLNRDAADLKKSGELPMDPSVPNDVCCANFVTATLQKAGLIDWHSNGVADMSQKLRAQGWHAVPASQAKPGDVAVINGSEHTELVSGNANGTPTLIGSNNVNVDGSQKVTNSHPYGEVVYLTPP